MRKLATLTAVAALTALVMTPNVAKAADEVTILICNQEPPDIFVRSCDSTDIADCSNRVSPFAAGDRCVIALRTLTAGVYAQTDLDTYTQGKGQDIIYTLTHD